MVAKKSSATALLEAVIAGVAAFLAAYGTLKGTSLFTPVGKGVVWALHEKPPQYALYLLAALAAVRIAILARTRAGGRELLVWTGVLVMAAGLIVSSFVRFEATIVLTEGQHVSMDPAEAGQLAVTAGPRASVPQFRLIAHKVTPSLSKSGLIAERISLRATYQQGDQKAREIRIGSLIPSFQGGTLLRVTRFGYSPRYRVTDTFGRVVEEGFVSLALFPPGMEDQIRSWDIPHIFYVQYHPGGASKLPGRGQAKEADPSRVFHLRVMRNLDPAFDGDVRLQEPVQLGAMVFSFEEIRTWAELSVVKDPGMLLFWGGCLVSAAAVTGGRRRRSAGAGAPAGPGGSEP